MIGGIPPKHAELIAAPKLDTIASEAESESGQEEANEDEEALSLQNLLERTPYITTLNAAEEISQWDQT